MREEFNLDASLYTIEKNIKMVGVQPMPSFNNDVNNNQQVAITISNEKKAFPPQEKKKKFTLRSLLCCKSKEYAESDGKVSISY